MTKNRFLLIVPLIVLLACSLPARVALEAIPTTTPTYEPTRRVPPTEPSPTVRTLEPSPFAKLIRPTFFITDTPEPGIRAFSMTTPNGTENPSDGITAAGQEPWKNVVNAG